MLRTMRDVARVDAAREHVGPELEHAVDELRAAVRRVRRLELHVQPGVAVDEVVAAAALDEVAAGAAEDDVAAGERGGAAEQRRRGRRSARCLRRSSSWPTIADGVARRLPRRMSLRFQPDRPSTWSNRSRRRVESGGSEDDDVEVGVRRLRVAPVGDPVEAEHALVPLDAEADDHDVVAALGVVVVVAAVADDDVVAGLVEVVLERRAVVALQEVGLAAALDPVVAVVAEHRVGRVAARR